jgi:hypothetical protein
VLDSVAMIDLAASVATAVGVIVAAWQLGLSKTDDNFAWRHNWLVDCFRKTTMMGPAAGYVSAVCRSY